MHHSAPNQTSSTPDQTSAMLSGSSHYSQQQSQSYAQATAQSAWLRGLQGEEEFLLLASLGGVRGIIESTAPSLVFLVLFTLTSNMTLTVVASAVLAGAQVLVRLVQRQAVTAALAGLVTVAICLFWAWNSHEARNYYAGGLLLTAADCVGLLLSVACKVPAIGLMVEGARAFPSLERPLREWLDRWREDTSLYRAYVWATLLWAGVFAVRLMATAPLYWSNQVTWLGAVKLALGVPVAAVATWLSYAMIIGPYQRHKQRLAAQKHDEANVPHGENMPIDAAFAERHGERDTSAEQLGSSARSISPTHAIDTANLKE